MLPADYAAMRAKEAPVYEFAGESYPVLELEPLLGEEPIKAQSGNVSLLMIPPVSWPHCSRAAGTRKWSSSPLS
jgi:hypothetical protein